MPFTYFPPVRCAFHCFNSAGSKNTRLPIVCTGIGFGRVLRLATYQRIEPLVRLHRRAASSRPIQPFSRASASTVWRLLSLATADNFLDAHCLRRLGAFRVALDLYLLVERFGLCGGEIILDMHFAFETNWIGLHLRELLLGDR